MKKDHQAMIALFLIPVYLLTVLNLFWPAQQVSAEENRTLHQMPAFSWSALASGRLTRDFEEFFSDQFPFRAFFIQANHQLGDLLKLNFGNSVEIVDGPGDDLDLGEGERIEPDPSDHVILPTDPTQATPTVGPTVTPLPTPVVTSAEPTPTETTAPTVAPTPTAKPPVDGEVIKISGVIIVDKRAMELYSFSESRSARYIQLINKLHGKLPDVRMIDMVAPTAVEFYSPEKYHSLSSSQKNAIATIYSKLADGIVTVDAYSKIDALYQDYLYFRTDHHWTARGAHCAYRAFAETTGITAIPLNQFETGIVPGDFLGSLYRYTQSSILKNNPDYVEYFLPQVSSEGIAFTSMTMSEGYKVQAVRTSTSSSNKYLVFIQGDNPLVRFKTSLTNGRKIVVLKESFGNALVPFLLNHYEEVYVIDPRSLTGNLPNFITQHGIQDVLAINYAFSVTNTKWLDGFEKMIG
jgi:hypothetical protein